MGIQNFYILARWLYKKGVPILPKLIYYLQYFIFNSSVPFEAKIGRGISFGYGGIAVVIHPRAIVGKDCTIGARVTIGGRSEIYEVPIIGDNVYVGTGAVVIGDVKVGDNAIIGANAVVIKNVKKDEVVAGVPAKHIKFRN
jgi:serine O-acetyltransferase